MKNSTYTQTSKLKERLISSGLKLPLCENPDCSVREDRKHCVPITLDHINDINNDNRIENLRILCFNCHGLTDTYGARNMQSVKIRPVGKILTLEEINAPKDTLVTVRRYNSGHFKSQVSYPSVKEIISCVELTGYVEYGKILGVSDNAIRKHLRKLGIDPLPKKLNKLEREARNKDLTS